MLPNTTAASVAVMALAAACRLEAHDGVRLAMYEPMTPAEVPTRSEIPPTIAPFPETAMQPSAKRADAPTCRT
jgi:hypothetical protein